MGVLITSSNFIGKYAIPQQASSDLDAFINDNEEQYLIELLGASMYDAFKANLAPAPPAPTSGPQPTPTNPGFLAIYNKFNVDYGSKIYKSRGLVLMLCGFIFFDYMKQVKYKATTQGIVVNTPDTTRESVTGNLYNYLNEAIETFTSIQAYILSIHPELFNLTNDTPFNGQRKRFGISILG